MAGKLASKPWDEAALAEKIRRLRRASGLTQAALADRMGISEPAVRNYELMRALPSEKHIESMAKAFGVRPECLHLYDFGVPSVLANSLFQIAETYGLSPTCDGGSAFLLPTSSFMSRFLNEWARRYSDLGKGLISRESYELWKDAYTADFDPEEFATRYEKGSRNLIPSWGAYCFSRKIRRIREVQGATQAVFSARLGIKEGVYRSYEQGRRLPRRSVLKGIADTLGITEGALTFFDFGSPVQAAHALFQITNLYALIPDVNESGEPVLRAASPGIEQVIGQWADELAAIDSGTAALDYQS